MAPGAWFSATMSAFLTISRNIALPCGDLRFSVTLCLLLLSVRK